ncbi:glutathione S-transferase family protein [Waterburya agarophytonicola K14]|uniref:Glutathione S-transferase family protein n=1 Tax=Waterburya agarophytonicola KI4 TaxID=2874699 RepID=A0A964BQ46_9CYAN|nr:glutathione S-transferase family protein [Waterburya agarophytonicola]MCC0176797.1 glutathione S-transferase family protein [Waterburya agarophytonicola KI4]
MNQTKIKLYGHELSGNVYKVRLLLALLDIEYQFVRIDVMKQEQKSAEYLKLNPFGQIPLLVDGDKIIPDAQAILVYLACQYGNEQWLPIEAEALSRVVRWLSTTTGEIRQGVESARLFYLFKAKTVDINIATQKSTFILEQIDRHLADREWLELGHPTIADIAAFPYIALAPDGKISLKQYPHILAWIERIKQLPKFRGMPGIDSPTIVPV